MPSQQSTITLVKTADDAAHLELAGSAHPVVVYVPGAGGFKPNAGIEALAQEFTVIAVQLPGIGADDRPALANLAEYAAFVDDIVTALRLERFSLLGTSFGGGVSLWYASEYRPVGLVVVALESPAALFDPERPKRELAADAPAAHRVSAASDQAQLEAQLATFEQPVLVAFGTADPIFPVSSARRYAHVIPQANTQFVYDAGHSIAGDRPEAFAALVGDFLRRGPGFVVTQRSTLIHP